MSTAGRLAGLASLLVLMGVGDAAGRTLRVATNGSNASSCGGVAAPCRTITAAIGYADDGDTIEVAPGRYGDLDRDGVWGEAGEEGSPELCGFGVQITKPIRLVSRDGARSTIVDGGDTAPGCTASVIAVYSPDVTVGTQNHGFSIVGISEVGIGVAYGSTNARVEGNRVDGGSGCGIGIAALPLIGPPDATIVGNDISGCRTGILTHGGPGWLIRGNTIASSGDEGIYTSSGGSVEANVVVGGEGPGIYVSSGYPVNLSKNVVLSNRGAGILVAFGEPTFEQNTIYDNDAVSRGGSNCGLDNQSGASVVAMHNYWGAGTGPGADPADDVCNSVAGSATDASSPAHAAFRALPKPLR